MEESSEEARSGRVAIVGRPNVGKSTLLNALLGQKLAITTPRPGTTRSNLLGVHASDSPPTQIAFIDTPGLERPRSVLGRVLVEEAQGSLEEADAVLLLIDASKGGPGNEEISPADEEILAQIQEVGRPVVLGLNKVDLVKPKQALLPRLAEWHRRHPDIAAFVPLSALRESNIEPLIGELRQLLPKGLMYPAEFLTDRPTRFFVAELVREAIIEQTRQELPYSVAVQVETFEEDTLITRIGATIFVDRTTHKGMIIGKGGAKLKAIGSAAREQIELMLETKVYLELFVRVEEAWTRDPVQVRRLTREAE